MVVNEVNIMNRAYQGCKVNFSSYRVDLHKTTARMQAIRDGNEVIHWLRYRLQQCPSLRDCYPPFNEDDYELGRKRTALFVDLFVRRLEFRIPELELAFRFDVFQLTSLPETRRRTRRMACTTSSRCSVNSLPGGSPISRSVCVLNVKACCMYVFCMGVLCM
jgi:hypothetical protein